MSHFIKLLLKERFKENFYYLYYDDNRLILITKTDVSKTKSIENIKRNEKKSLIIYIIQLNDKKDSIVVDLSLEPVSGYYKFNYEHEQRLIDERNYFSSLANYYKILDKNIHDMVVNKFSLIKETIFKKLELKKLTKVSTYSSIYNKKKKRGGAKTEPLGIDKSNVVNANTKMMETNRIIFFQNLNNHIFSSDVCLLTNNEIKKDIKELNAYLEKNSMEFKQHFEKKLAEETQKKPTDYNFIIDTLKNFEIRNYKVIS